MKTFLSLILLLGAIAIFFFYTDVHYKNIGTLKQQDRDYNTALTQSNTLLTQRDQLQDQYKQIPQSDLDRLAKLLPSSVDNVRLVKDMSGLASNYGLIMKDIKVSQGTTNSVATLGPDSKSYGSIILSFSVTASYQTFKQFLSSLEQSLRLVDVTSLSFAATERGDQYNYSVSVRTYWLK